MKCALGADDCAWSSQPSWECEFCLMQLPLRLDTPGMSGSGSSRLRLCRAAKTLCSLAVERNLPTFGVASLRKWLDKRCEKKIAKWEPVPAPTLPLPWEHFKRMPKRLKGGRHRDVHLSEDMEVPDVHRGEPCSRPASVPNHTLPL